MLDVPSALGRTDGIMNRIRDAWNRLASSPHRLVLSAAIGLLAVAGGIGFAVAVNGVRQTAGTAASPSTVNTVDASESEAESPSPTATLTATSTPSPTASATGSPTASPTASPTPTATPTPTPTPTPQPTQAPSACDGFTFSPAGAVSVDSLAELEDGIVGTWAGCATTPWVPRYWVTITFRADGTYSGFAEEGRGPAFYYGTDEDMYEKLYEL